MGKKNLLIVTEHYPCGTQESFLENEIRELARLFRVYLVTTDVERQMTHPLPKEVIFCRPSERPSSWKKIFLRVACRFSRGYQTEKKLAKAQGRWNKLFQRHLLDMLVKSRSIYDYIRSLEFFAKDEPLLVYAANFNDYLYGLCSLKAYSDDIRVVARCHNANMFDPRTGKRRDTLNGIINREIDRVYFTSDHSRRMYLKEFSGPDTEIQKFRVAELGVPGQDRPELDPLPEFFLRMVSCSPMEDDKRLRLIVDALSLVNGGCIEWVHMGVGSRRKEIMESAQKLMEEKRGVRCRFLGNMTREGIYRYYRENYVDLFISVSQSESVPTAMMEAMANRIFVAATNVDGVSAVVDNDNGFLMPGDITAEQLAQVLNGFCHISKQKMVKKGEQAYQSWQERFDANKSCAFFAEELAKLSGMTLDEIATARKEAEEREKEPEREPLLPELLQNPASRANIKETPLSFRDSLVADGLLPEESASQDDAQEEWEEVWEDAPADPLAVEKPQEKEKRPESSQPVETDTPAEEDKPVETSQPVETPVEEDEPTEASQPVEAPDEENKSAEAVQPAETEQSEETVSLELLSSSEEAGSDDNENEKKDGQLAENT